MLAFVRNVDSRSPTCRVQQRGPLYAVAFPMLRKNIYERRTGAYSLATRLAAHSQRRCLLRLAIVHNTGYKGL